MKRPASAGRFFFAMVEEVGAYPSSEGGKQKPGVSGTVQGDDETAPHKISADLSFIPGDEDSDDD